MYAVIEHKGKQYKVSEGMVLKLPRDEALKKDDVFKFEKISIFKDKSDSIIIGTPHVKGVVVMSKVLEQIRDKKIIVFKKKRRHNYRRKIGHRQDLTLFRIDKITSGNVEKSSKVKEIDNNTLKKEGSDGS